MMNTFNSIVRPLLTILGFSTFLGIGVWGLVVGKLTFSDFFTSYGPIVTMMIGYWFGERKNATDAAS
jgi:hypothetical protein